MIKLLRFVYIETQHRLSDSSKAHTYNVHVNKEIGMHVRVYQNTNCTAMRQIVLFYPVLASL